MNKQEFISYISSPEKLDEKTLPHLEKVAEEFPYFQTAHLLLAKNLHNINSIHYNNQLKLASIFAGDRKMLHKLIYSKTSSQENISETEVVHEQEIKQEIREEKKTEEIITKTNPSDEILKKALAEIETIKLKMAEKVETKKEEIKIEEKKEEIKSELGEEVFFPEVEKMKKQIQTLDELYTTQAIESSMELDIANAEKEMEVKAKESEGKSQKEEIKKEEILKQPRLLSRQHDKQEKKETRLDTTKKHSFTDWLKMKQTELPKIKTEKKTGTDLIEKFIIEEPKIGKIKADFFSPVNMAKQSVTDDYSMVTETLAKIYEKQGAYNKAIEAYEKLILVYPEKSASFATRIEEIKKLIN